MSSTLINTDTLGKLSRTKLRRLIKENGTQAALARSINVSPSTVRNWGLRLRRVNS